jgi:hypothetical protein
MANGIQNIDWYKDPTLETYVDSGIYIMAEDGEIIGDSNLLSYQLGVAGNVIDTLYLNIIDCEPPEENLECCT